MATIGFDFIWFIEHVTSRCSPFRTFSGPVGGIRSALVVDSYHLRPYYYSELLCINTSAWDRWNDTEAVRAAIQTLDFSSMESDLRGFSDALRVGRYAYFTPLNSAEHTYSSKLIRLSLGDVDIGATLAGLQSIRSVVDVLDLAKINTTLSGYSGLFSSGQHLFLVPYRNAYQPSNGQRGHGVLTRLNMNDFSPSGIDYLDLTSAQRNQIPSFADVNLRGYSAGFASEWLIDCLMQINALPNLIICTTGGQYGVLVPFFNAVFSGKIARFLTQQTTLGTNIQELDTTIDRTRPNIYKGYRGGFVSLWNGVDAP